MSHRMLFLDIFEQFNMTTCKFVKMQQRILQTFFQKAGCTGLMDRQPYHLPTTSYSHTHILTRCQSKRELAVAGLDSSVLSPSTENLSEINENDKEFVPSTTSPLESFSEEYHQALIKALALDSPTSMRMWIRAFFMSLNNF